MPRERAEKERWPVLIIGIDAASMELIRPWAIAGELPVFRTLFSKGASGLLRSVPNFNSASAWTSMVTGKNPGKHGIFAFTQYRPASLDFDYVNGSYRAEPAVWNLLSESGRQVGVVNVPMTYPAEKVNGFMISGIDAPGVNDPAFVYPQDLHRELLTNVGGYVIETGLGSYARAGKLDEGIHALKHTIERRLAATRHLMTTRPWDFFMVVFRATDPAQHYFWRYIEPEYFQVSPKDRDRYGSVILDIYRQIDVAVGELIGLAGDDTVTMVVSDHGARADTGKAQALPRWLEAMGMLRYRQKRSSDASAREWLRQTGWNVLARTYPVVDKRFSHDFKKWLSHRFPILRAKTESHIAYSPVDWGATRAFTDGKRAEIWINLRGHQPYGIVEPGDEYERACAIITERLYAARDADNGEQLVERVYHRDEVYHGMYVGRSTDLVIHWRKGAVGRTVDFGNGQIVTTDMRRNQKFSGAHDPMGIVFMSGGPVRKAFVLEDTDIVDIAPTALYLAGEPVPDDMDGRILLEALDENYVASHPPVTADGRGRDGVEVSTTAYSEKDEAVIAERLRSLGYIE